MSYETSQFIDSNKHDWQKLAYFIEIIHKRGIPSLSGSQLKQLGTLYRKVSADLAFAREHLKNQRIVYYLNTLVGNAHGHIYYQKTSSLKGILNFLLCDFPQLFRETKSFTVFALLVFLFFSCAGGFIVSQDNSFAILLVPSTLLNKIDQQQMWTNDITSIAPLASSGIMTNNISVTFFAFAMGITCGLGTFYVLALNGLLFGVITYLTFTHNMALQFTSFVLPHGIIELPCIFIAAGGGFMIAQAILVPGAYRRRDALIINSKKAAKLILGCIPLMMVAGFIEGFLSPSPLPPFFKIAFAILTGFLFFSYLLLGQKQLFNFLAHPFFKGK